MNKKLWTVAALASALAVAACQPVDKEEDSVADGSGDGGAVVPDVDGPNDQDGNNGIDDPADDTPGKVLSIEGAVLTLSASDYSPDSWNNNDTAVKITAFLQQRNFKPAPDGSIISFVAFGGGVGELEYIGNPTVTDGSPILGFDTCQVGESVPGSGSCTTIWSAKGLQSITPGYEGRVVIMAIAEGNDWSADQLGYVDNLYRAGDLWESYGDPLLDIDQNGERSNTKFMLQAGSRVLETFEYAYDANASGQFEKAYDNYYGWTCENDSVSPTCGTSAWVHETIVLNQSSSNLTVSMANTDVSLPVGTTVSVPISIATRPTGKYPPTGTTLSVTCDSDAVSGEVSSDTVKPLSESDNRAELIDLLSAPWNQAVILTGKASGRATCEVTVTAGENSYFQTVQVTVSG